MLNHIVLMGRLTRDPELRRTQTGTAVTSFSLAVDRDFRHNHPLSGAFPSGRRTSSTLSPGEARRSLSPSTSPRAVWPP